MALSIRNHGGSCCGMGHISGFTTNGPYNAAEHRYEELTTEDRINDIKDAMRRLWPDSRNRQRITEATLTDNQMRCEANRAALEACGFRLVSRFRNSNSTNTVNVFHHHPNLLSTDAADLPFAWNPDAPVNLSPPRPTGNFVRVYTSPHGGETRGCGRYESEEAAMRGMPRNLRERLVRIERIN